MKKILFFAIMLGLFLIPNSCSFLESELDNKDLPDFDLSENLTVSEYTEQVSPIFLNMGVTSINVNRYENTIVFSVNTDKQFFMNGCLIDFSDYIAICDNEVLYLNENPRYSVSLKGRIPYLITPEYIGSISGAKESIKDVYTSILLLYLNELTLEEDMKLDSFTERNRDTSKKCSFWDTYYVYKVGVSEDVANDGLEGEIEEYDLSDCSKIGGVNSSCLFAEHFCVSSQAYCCN